MRRLTMNLIAFKAFLFGLMLSTGHANNAELLCLKLLQDPNSSPLLIQFCLNLSPSSRKQDPVTQPPLIIPSKLQNCTRLPPRPQQASSDPLSHKPDLQSLLKEGVASILLPSHVKEAILILGNTGSGKTTITQLIAGNTSRLHSVLSYSNKTIIIDDDERIGLPSTKSKTLFPELVIDRNTSSTIYDCPGFDDSRGPEIDIAANYFIKLVTDHLSSAKLLFLVTYSSVKIGNERLDFDRLASHAVKFMKNISKFVPNSFGLIVTKVNSYELGEYLEDDAIIGEIVEFLSTYRETLKANLQDTDLTPEEETLERKKLQFVETLLANDAANVWFSRSPDRCGPLSSIPSVMDSRTKIITFHQKLKYTPTTPSDFGYSLKAKTLLRVKSFTSEINGKIKNATTELAQNVKKGFSKMMRKKRNLFTKESSTKLDYLNVKNLMENLDHENVSQNPELLLETTAKALKDTNLDYSSRSRELREELERQGEYLNFFEKVTEAEVQRDVTDWIKPLKEFVEAPLKKDHDWYNFLTSVYSIVSSYGFQQAKAPTGDKVYSISELPSIGIPVSSHILELVNSSQIRQDLNILKEIVNFGAKPSQILCSSERMTVTGNFVRATNFVDSNGALSCYKTMPEIKFVEIFATHTFFLDADIIAPRELQLSIVSPKWEIISNRTINLNGKNAPSHSLPQARNGPSPSTDGADGQPGFSGGNAGTFFGVGDVFVNLVSLTITANGGNGGDGQRGGNGTQGGKGWSPSSSDVGGCWSPVNILPVFGTYTSGRVGNSGSPGGRGGHGGAAGVPGHSGKVLLVATSHEEGQPQEKVEARNGLMGKVGRGGSGGEGGQHGDGVQCTQTHRWIFCGTGGCFSYTIHINAAPGQDGMDGAHNNYQQLPPMPLLTEPKYKIINRFKNFYGAHQPLSFLKTSFTTRLNADDKINGFYTPTAFGEELLNIISQPESSATSHLYPQFLNRLDAHVEARMTKSQLTPEEKKFFMVLYSTAISKLYTLSQESCPTTVINLQSYLDVVLQRIENLKGIQAQVAIQQQRDLLQSETQKRISIAQQFIRNSITPEIKLIQKELDATIAALVQDVVNLQIQEKTKEDRHTKEEVQDKFNTVGFFNNLFSGLRVISNVLAVFGSEGFLISQTIKTAATVFDAIVQPNGRVRRSAHPQTFTDTSQNDGEFAKMHLIFGEIVKIISTNDKLSRTLYPAISAFNETIRTFGIGPQHNYQSLQSLSTAQKLEKAKNVLLQFLDNIENEYQLANDTGAVETVKKLQAIIRVAGLGIDIYKETQSNEVALKDIGSLTEKAEGNAKKLEEFKESIYQVVIPMIDRMNTDISNITQNLATGTSSPLGLKMSKWKVKEGLTNLKFSIKKYTQGLTLQENFVHLIDKLEDGLILMIDVYDQIEKYKDVKQLSDFMTSLSSQEIIIKDPTMLKLSSALNLVTESHIFLAEYEKALHAFKQWVFPFAHTYRDLLMPVTHINTILTSNSSSLQIELYTKQIQNIQLRLKHYRATSVGSHDTHLLRSSFYSGLRSSGPFFVWRNDKWRNSIGNILAGVKTQIMADITDPGTSSLDGKAAVKFNLIELNFKVKESGDMKKEQEELDEKLKDFSVTLTHGGISRYKFQDEVFVMIGDNQTLRYNFERGPHGGRTGTNVVYEKFKSGDFLLSPYTLWTIQLNKINGGGNYSFSDLKKYSNLVDLELVGNGTYVDEEAFDGVDLNIEEYYEIDQFDK